MSGDMEPIKHLVITSAAVHSQKEGKVSDKEEKTQAIALKALAPLANSAKALSNAHPSLISVRLVGCDQEMANEYFKANASSLRLGPDLLLPGDPRLGEVDRLYPIRKKQDSKEAFRSRLLEKLESKWAESLGEVQAQKLVAQFKKYAHFIQKDGVAAFGDLISKEEFTVLIEDYSKILETEGNKTWLHSFVDFRNHPAFLLNSKFNGAFFHPLNIALIAYKMGGPIRVTDARGKDAQPITAVTLDNMLHIDNVPFTEEIKQTLFWRQGKPLGPNGQCFVCLPGTNQSPRASDGAILEGKLILFREMTKAQIDQFKEDDQAIVFTTEAGSVFRKEEELQGALQAQKKIRGQDKPLVLALRDDERVITATAETGNLVHHRYRVEKGDPRSCLLIAFHLVSDDPGALVIKENLDRAKKEVEATDLSLFLLGSQTTQDKGMESSFISALEKETTQIEVLLTRLEQEHKEGFAEPEFIKPESKALSEEELEDWRKSVLTGPGTEKIKREQKILSLNAMLTQSEFVNKIKQLMAYDKTGVLELILYSDGREEKRKWARNQIRELRLEQPLEVKLENDPRPPSLDKRFALWADQIDKLNLENLRNKEQLADLSKKLYQIAKKEVEKGTLATDELKPKISKAAVLPAVSQLIQDLGVAIENCSNREAYISTGLFLFWACDTLMRVLPEKTDKSEIVRIGRELLNHYVTVNLVAEIQLQEPDSLVEISDEFFD